LLLLTYLLIVCVDPTYTLIIHNINSGKRDEIIKKFNDIRGLGNGCTFCKLVVKQDVLGSYYTSEGGKCGDFVP